MLATAIIRPRWLPEAAAAGPAAVVVIVTGALPWHQARTEAGRLLPVLVFLGAILVVGHVCQLEGLFAAAGARLARASRGSPVRLLGGVFGLASVTTAVLSLDTTVVLLTPVVHDTATRLRVRPKPHVYACTHLANSASLLLPVSNLTNLLAFSVAGLTLIHFGALMALPWLVAIAVEYAAFRWFFAGDLAVTPPAAARTAGGPLPRIPRFALVTVLATLAGFVLTSLAGVNPAWAAVAGAVVLAAGSLIRGQDGPAGLVRAVSIPFLLFVLGLGIVVEAVVQNGLGAAADRGDPGRVVAALPAGPGRAGGPARERGEQPAGGARAAVRARRAGAAGLPGPGARRADRGGRRPEPELRRLAGHAAVAAPAGGPRPPHGPGRVHPSRAAHRARGLVLVTVALWAVLRI